MVDWFIEFGSAYVWDLSLIRSSTSTNHPQLEVRIRNLDFNQSTNVNSYILRSQSTTESLVAVANCNHSQQKNCRIEVLRVSFLLNTEACYGISVDERHIRYNFIWNRPFLNASYSIVLRRHIFLYNNQSTIRKSDIIIWCENSNTNHALLFWLSFQLDFWWK